MKFTVIVPFYNTESYINQCLDSLEHQSFSDFEAIFVDDGSTDRSADIVLSYQRDSRIKMMKSGGHCGPSVARNCGIEASCGDYILFLDSDDWLEEKALMIFSNELDDGDYDMLAYGFRNYSDEEGIFYVVKNPSSELYVNGIDYYKSCSGGFAFGTVCGRVYSRRLIDANLRFDSEIRYNEDILFSTTACIYAHSVKVIDDVLYNYRIGRPQSLITTSEDRRFVDAALSANKLFFIVNNKAGIEKQVFFRAISYIYRSSLTFCEECVYRRVSDTIVWRYFKQASNASLIHLLVYYGLKFFPKSFRIILSKRK